jgi:hypothetical protein
MITYPPGGTPGQFGGQVYTYAPAGQVPVPDPNYPAGSGYVIWVDANDPRAQHPFVAPSPSLLGGNSSLWLLLGLGLVLVLKK